MNKIFFYISSFLLLQACSSGSLSPSEYIKWVESEENGLWVAKKIEHFEYSILYKPAEYIALREMKKDSVSGDKIDKAKNELKDLQYFTLKIEADEGNDLLKAEVIDDKQYFDRLNYLSGLMQDDIKLIDGSDTLFCILYHMERNYGLAPYNNFVLGFKATQNENDKQIEINDKAFGIGKVILKIQKEDIENIPQLKI